MSNVQHAADKGGIFHVIKFLITKRSIRIYLHSSITARSFLVSSNFKNCPYTSIVSVSPSQIKELCASRCSTNRVSESNLRSEHNLKLFYLFIMVAYLCHVFLVRGSSVENMNIRHSTFVALSLHGVQGENTIIR
jgi:hypothetical protein